jgi:hypothetical protein
MEKEEWSTKDDIDFIKNAYMINESVNYPSVKHDKLDKIKNRTSIQHKKKKKKSNTWKLTKSKRPTFCDPILTREEESQVNNHYEIELEHILSIEEHRKIVKSLSDLDFWFVNFISPFPQLRDVNSLELWKKKEFEKISGGYSTSCPEKYRIAVRNENKHLYTDLWKKEMRQKINESSKKITCFKVITVAKLPPKADLKKIPVVKMRKFR